jgi:hypothetical protein
MQPSPGSLLDLMYADTVNDTVEPKFNADVFVTAA